MKQLENELHDGSGTPKLQAALKIIKEFCGNFSEAEIQERIMLAAKTCLTADAPEFAKPGARQDIRYVFEQVSILFHGVYELNTFLK